MKNNKDWLLITKNVMTWDSEKSSRTMKCCKKWRKMVEVKDDKESLIKITNMTKGHNDICRWQIMTAIKDVKKSSRMMKTVVENEKKWSKWS